MPSNLGRQARALERQQAAQQPQAAADQTRRINPEIEGKLNAFIGENPKLMEAYMAMPKEQLARKLMLSKMWKAESQDRKFDKLVAVASQDPALKASVDKALANDKHPMFRRQQIATRIIEQNLAQKAVQALSRGA